MRRSKIWLMPKQDLQKLIDESNSLAEVLRKIGLKTSGNQRTLVAKIKYEQIDVCELEQKRKALRKLGFNKAIPLSEILIVNSTYSRHSLKIRLIKEGLLKNECSLCKQLPLWQNMPLVLVLDHINGQHDDNRIDNLRLLCPNCNSQTPTFAGKNRTVEKNLCECGQTRCKHAKKCHACNSKMRRKTQRPNEQALREEIAKYGFAAVGRKYGVSDNAIRKWLKNGSVV